MVEPVGPRAAIFLNVWKEASHQRCDITSLEKVGALIACDGRRDME